MFEFALMGFGKVQDTVISDHIAQALQEFEARRGGALPRGWFVQFQRSANDPIPACPACGKPL